MDEGEEALRPTGTINDGCFSHRWLWKAVEA